MRLAATLLIVSLCAPAAMRAQCPDGSPPPCSQRATRSVARTPPPQKERARKLILLPFRNVTRKAEQEWLVTGAPLMLAQVLGQFRELEIVPAERLQAAMRAIGIRSDSVPDASQLHRLADETGGWTAITGNIFATANGIRVNAQAIDIPTSRVTVRAETEAPNESDV